MSTTPVFQPGIHTLLTQHRDWLTERRIGLLSHTAAVNGTGIPSAQLLSESDDCSLVSLMGPELGYFGSAPAGEHVNPETHPIWQVPIHSLYGRTRRPTAAMLEDLDAVVFDIQDLGVRCYTYVSTLRYLLESAAEHQKTVIVADRPIPFPNTLDGPMLQPSHESFVGCLPLPFVYGMTPGETAQWIVATLGLEVDLKVAPMQGYQRHPARPFEGLPWIPPSPGIVSWESATCYPTTVFGEALPAIDHGRVTGLPFQLVGAPWIDGQALAADLTSRQIAGVCWHPHPYYLMTGSQAGTLVKGLRLTVTDSDAFQPMQASVAILHALREHYGVDAVWHHAKARPEFFDQLMGNSTLRCALQDGIAPDVITRSWAGDLAAFAESREKALLYAPAGT